MIFIIIKVQSSNKGRIIGNQSNRNILKLSHLQLIDNWSDYTKRTKHSTKVT